MNKSKQSGNSSFQAEGIPPKEHHYEGFWAKSCMILGTVHVIVGVLCIIMNGIGIHFHAHMHNYAQGMWGGAVFFVTGFICVFAGFYRTPIPVKVAMAASIISILIAIPIMGITAAGLDHDRKVNFSYWIKDDYYGNDYLDGKESFRKAAHAMLLALSLLELVIGSLTLAITVHAVFYCKSYNGANQSTGNAMMFPKSTSPIPPEISMSSNHPMPGVPDHRYGNHDTSVTSDPAVSPRDVNPNLSRGFSPDISKDSSQGLQSSFVPEPVAQPGLQSAGPSAFQQYPGQNQQQPPPAVVQPQKPASAVGSGRGPPQPQVAHARHNTSQSSLESKGSKTKGPKLQTPHNRHNTSTSSVETTGSINQKKRGPALQTIHQRHDMSYSSVDSYPSVQGGGAYPPPDRTSSRSSNPGAYPHYGGGGGGNMPPPARAFEGYSHPGYGQPPAGVQGQYQPPYQQQRRV